MKITRVDSNLYGIFGTMTQDDGTYFCRTLEHAFKNADGTFSPAIPPGVYTCTRRQSPKFGYDVFQIMNVKGHTYIEIHIGNYNSDTDGCVLLGTALGTGCILNSRDAFDAFMLLKYGVNTFTLTIQ